MDNCNPLSTLHSPPSTPKRVLVVGAGGFAGGFIVEEALRRGHEVWAGVRESTSRRYLTDPRIKFLTLDFDNPSTLASQISAPSTPEEESPREACPGGGSCRQLSTSLMPNASGLEPDFRWDWIVYNLGATKCLSFSDFSKINCDYLRAFTDALQEAGKVPDKLLYMSSLSAVGPGDEKGFSPFTEEMIPHPNTRYGASKLKAEMHLAMSGIPHIIFRATGIY
ncbi:MAG: NAD-dependent epimerase/dehydratase family protein, partial [Muribaculaceae bacterium]|nr:NAD-dependent epimerase/dehydratase family protein [Muribaculaceae bacterium]